MSATAPPPSPSKPSAANATAAEQLDRSLAGESAESAEAAVSDFALRRLLPKGWLFRGRGLATLLLSMLATVALIATLLGVLLLAGLLVDRGRVAITPEQAEPLKTLLGDEMPAASSIASDGRAVVTDAGILPSMVRPTRIGPRWLAGLYRTLPWLRATSPAFTTLCGLTLLFGILWKLGELAARSQADRLAHDVSVSLRGQIHRQALRLNPGDLDARGRRDAESLFVDQVDRVTAAVRDTVFHTARDPFRLLALAALLLVIDPMLTLLALVPLLAGWILIEWERVHGGATERMAKATAQRHLRALSEALGKSRLIRGYGLESFEADQFRTHMDRQQKVLTSSERAWRWRQRLLWTLALSMVALVVFLVGSHVLRSGRAFTPADAVLFLATLALIAATLTGARGLPTARRQIAEIAGRINRYLDRIPDVSQAVGAKFIPPMTRHLDYQNVSYTTPAGLTLLRDFELRVPAGSSVALVSIGGSERRGDGADPSEEPPPEAAAGQPRKSRDGQAALAAALLLPRFLEPQSGRVLFDGEDIAWGTLESLREEVSFVGGREPFFTGTVEENLDCGAGRGMPELIEAAKMVHAHKAIMALPQGYDTPLGLAEHAAQLTPGTAFLLGLARAAVRNPAILIVSEPSAELSEDEKALIDDAYQRLRPGRTLMFLPQRLSTMRKCDRVVLIRGGSVAAVGHQRDLLAKSDLYRHWEYVTFNPIKK